MTTKIGINGFGRIGRQVLKAIMELHGKDLEVVAINDLFDAETNAHLFQFDTNYGVFNGDVAVKDGNLVINGKTVRAFSEKDPGNLPWKDLGVEIVVESTGVFTDTSKEIGPQTHINKGGAKKVIISAPAKGEDLTLVLGVNGDQYDPAKHNIVSNASCTTNCLAPAVKVLVDNWGIQKGTMTTVHSYTNDQRILDLAHKDPRRARAAALNIIPTTTGAAKAVGKVLPEVAGKLDGYSLRVPTPTVSVSDIVILTAKDTTVDDIKAAYRAAASGPMKGILGVEDRPLVSMDFKGDPRSSIIDMALISVTGGNLVKVVAWYDNEWGYSCRTADLAAMMATSL